MRVTPVACTAACFFMCHLSASSVSLSDDRRDLHVGVRLPVRLLTLVMLAASEFDDPHLVALAMTLDRRNHLRAAHVGGANCHVRTGADEQHLIEFDTGTGLGIELFNAHDGTFLNAVLFTARGNHGIHRFNSSWGPHGPAKEPRIVRRWRLGVNSWALAMNWFTAGPFRRRPLSLGVAT